MRNSFPARRRRVKRRTRFDRFLWRVRHSLRSTPLPLLSTLVLLAFGSVLVRELLRDVVLIDPISVPEELGKSGLTGEVLSGRVVARIQEIERDAHTHLPSDLLALSTDPSGPDIEVPGTKLSVNTVADAIRRLFGQERKHIRVEVSSAWQDAGAAAKQPGRNVDLVVTVHQGHDWTSYDAVPLAMRAPENLVDGLATRTLEFINRFVLAVHFYDKNDYAEARRLITQILEQDHPGKEIGSAAHNLLGLMLDDPNHPEAAAQEYELAAKIDETNALPLVNLGRLRAARDASEAIRCFKRALAADPKTPEAYGEWGFLLQDQHDSKGAIDKFEQALKRDKNYARAYNGIGLVFFDEKKYSEAARE